jgi:hypothetical protein
MQLRVNGTTLSGETAGEGAPCLCLHGGPGTDSSSTLVVFERSGHSPHVEEREAFTRCLGELLARAR